MKNLIMKNLLLIIVFTLLVNIPVFSTENTVITTTLTKNVQPWVKIECIKDKDLNFKFEDFHKKSVQTHKIVVKAFGSKKPHSRLALLHYAPGYDKNTTKNPVLLVHGAGDHAYHGWCHPYHMELPEGQSIEKPGLMQYLSSKGYPVFALTYSHPHGDNFYQAEQIYNAIKRIKEIKKGGKDFKVDIYCHSKGAMATRIYLSSLGNDFPEYKWLTPYKNNVRKVIFAGSPLKGLDTQFRYYTYNLMVKTQDLPAPMGTNKFTMYGLYSDCTKHNTLFPGQDQMLHNWVKDGIDLTYHSYTADMNMTMNSLYNGGLTTLMASGGIDRAINNAGDVINKLNKKGIDSRVRISVIAGTKQAINTIDLGLISIPIGELAAPSDGVAFLKSTTYTDGLTVRGAKLDNLKTINTHHVGLLVVPEALKFVDEELK